jgi:hypothetical protein
VGYTVVAGMAHGVHPAVHLWTPIEKDRFVWPGSRVKRDGDRWVGRVLVGQTPADVNITMDVLILAVDAEADMGLEQWHADGAAGLGHPAFHPLDRPLPDGCCARARATITSAPSR